MLKLLEQNLAKNKVRLDAHQWTALTTAFVHKRLRKHQYIVQQGEAARYETFVLKGLTRTYEVGDAGQEHVLFFGPEEWWVGDLYSFLSGQPSKYNVDCLEETEVLQITKPALDGLYETVPELNRYFRILFQNAFIASAERVSASLSKSALDRYLEFLQRYPQLERRLPNHQIASYLGITPQSLSRIRRQFTNGR